MTTRVINRSPDFGLKIKLQKSTDHGGEGPAPACDIERFEWLGGYDQERRISPPSFDGIHLRSPSSAVIGYQENGLTYRLVGSPVGKSMQNIVWEWSWAGRLAAVLDVQQVGQLLQVTWNDHRLRDYPDMISATLTAIAYCRDTEIGSLSLVAVNYFVADALGEMG